MDEWYSGLIQDIEMLIDILQHLATNLVSSQALD
jgi:hypothetical protein